MFGKCLRMFTEEHKMGKFFFNLKLDICNTKMLDKLNGEIIGKGKSSL